MKDINVQRTVHRHPGVLKSHFHNQYEVYHLCEGHMRYIIADRIYTVGPGDTVLIPCGIIHNTAYDAEKTSRLLINFSEELVADKSLLECFNKSIIPASLLSASEFKGIFERIERETKNEDEYSEILAGQYVTELLILFSRTDDCPPPALPDGYSRIMQSAVRYINENFATEITLDELAKRFSLSKSFFSRKFKEVTGFGICEYITLVRIKNAERMLNISDASVTDIAFACGFNDSSYFTSTFKRVMGKTPLKYKKEIKNNGKHS